MTCSECVFHTIPHLPLPSLAISVLTFNLELSTQAVWKGWYACFDEDGKRWGKRGVEGGLLYAAATHKEMEPDVNPHWNTYNISNECLTSAASFFPASEITCTDNKQNQSTTASTETEKLFNLCQIHVSHLRWRSHSNKSTCELTCATNCNSKWLSSYGSRRRICEIHDIIWCLCRASTCCSWRHSLFLTARLKWMVRSRRRFKMRRCYRSHYASNHSHGKVSHQ